MAVGLALAVSLAAPAEAKYDPWGVESLHTELGVFGGVLILPAEHELFAADAGVPQRALQKTSVNFGARVAFYPASFFGIELEGAASPSGLRQVDGSALLYRGGGHLVLQYPARLSVFALGGMGVYGIASDTEVQGNDLDLAAHWGVGLKFYFTKSFGLRVDGRQILTGWAEQGAEDGVVSLHYEVLGGFTFAFGRYAEPPADRDKDGVPDATDACPDQASDQPGGCPPADTDRDGILDTDDQCPAIAAQTPNGCPADEDKDGVPDEQDKCPAKAASNDHGCPDTDEDGVHDGLDECMDKPGTLANGCPDTDPDKDGLIGDKDLCPADSGVSPDGCPKEVQSLLTDTQSIQFRSGGATIAPRSVPALNQVFKALERYPTLRFEIRGHTDSAGNADANLRLSQLRANVVRAYFVDLGIDRDRLTAVGYGEAVPIATNRTRAGRAKNRRIEFRLQK